MALRAVRPVRVSNISITSSSNDLPCPNFMVATVRGAVPHLTPDHLGLQVPAAAIFIEDFFDAAGSVPGACLPERIPLRAKNIFCLARNPIGPMARRVFNNDKNITVWPTQGPRIVPVDTVAEAMINLGPDFLVVPYDQPNSSTSLPTGKNRMHKLQGRSIAWAHVFSESHLKNNGKCLLVPALSSELAADTRYQADLGKALSTGIDKEIGTSPNEDMVYGPCGVPGKFWVDSHKAKSVMEMLDRIGEGADIVYAPLETYTDTGRALLISLDCSTPTIFEDLNDNTYVKDMSPLGKTGYARAYIHHLLEAKEMTAYVILQQHNLNVLEKFFEDIRQSIAKGQFKEQLSRCRAHYSG